MIAALRIVAAVYVCGALALASCSTPPSDSRYVEASLPDRASFPAVAQLLDHRCGTLDCHGSTARNLRIFGSEGLRLASSDRPLAPICNTSAETDEDFASVVGLEPEIMNAVVASGGVAPERLTMVRKARGTESHKGYTIWAAGSDEDNCLTSWLANALDREACGRALASTKCAAP